MIVLALNSFASVGTDPLHATRQVWRKLDRWQGFWWYEHFSVFHVQSTQTESLHFQIFPQRQSALFKA